MESDGIRLCGGLAVTVDGQRVEGGLPGRQGRLVVAYLATRHPEPVPRDELLGVLWPGTPPPSARDALNVVLSKAKRAVGPSVLAGRDALRLDLPVDVRAAEAAASRAESALAARQPGRALAAARDAIAIAERGVLPGLEAEWIDTLRRDVEELLLHSLELGVRAALAGGVLTEAEQLARQLVAASPWRESGHRLLMEALAARGDTAEALRVFDALRVRLRHDLGTAPGPELQRLHAKLLAVADEAPEAPQPTALPFPVLLARVDAAGFVGRDGALRALERYWQAAASGAPRLVAVAGEPGVGKTALLARFAARVHASGAQVAYGRSDEDALLSYQPVAEALAALAGPAPPAQLARILPSPAEEATPAAPEIERYRLFRAVEELLSDTAARAPLLLVLDDIHWADRPTLALLRHLARSPARAHWLAAVTFRDVEVSDGHPLWDLLADLRRDRVLERLDVLGLSAEDVSELAAQLSDRRLGADDVRRLHAGTAGNPLFIRELLAAAEEGGTDIADVLHNVPEGVSDVIQRRVSELPAAGRAALAVAAVAGHEFDLRVLEPVRELAGCDLLGAIEGATAARLVEEVPGSPGRYAFSHALMRDALYGRLSATRRARLHLQLAEVLETVRDAAPADLAHHLVQAGGHVAPTRVVAALRDAGDAAVERFAYEEATTHYGAASDAARAAGLPREEQCSLLLAEGRARQRGGDATGARVRFAAAAELARDRDPALLVEAALGVHGRYTETGVVDEQALALLEEAIAACDDAPGAPYRDLRTIATARLAQALYWTDERDRVDRLSAEAVAAAEELDDARVLAVALEARHEVLRVPWCLKERTALVERVLERALEHRDRELEAQAHQLCAVDALEAGDLRRHDQAVAAVAALAIELRQPMLDRYATMWRQVRAQLDGRLEEAERLAHDALAAALRAGAQDGPQALGAQLYGVLRFRGALEPMVAIITAMRDQYPSRLVWRAGLATLQAELGDSRAARAELDVVGRRAYADVPPDFFWTLTLALAGDAAVRLRDAGHAAPLRERLAPFSDLHVMARGAACYGPIARTLGGLAGVLGDAEDMEARYAEALELARGLRSPLLEAQVRLEHAEQRRELGLPGADELLHQAQALSRSLGADRLAARAETLSLPRTRCGAAARAAGRAAS